MRKGIYHTESHAGALAGEDEDESGDELGERGLENARVSRLLPSPDRYPRDRHFFFGWEGSLSSLELAPNLSPSLRGGWAGDGNGVYIVGGRGETDNRRFAGWGVMIGRKGWVYIFLWNINKLMELCTGLLLFVSAADQLRPPGSHRCATFRCMIGPVVGWDREYADSFADAGGTAALQGWEFSRHGPTKTKVDGMSAGSRDERLDAVVRDVQTRFEFVRGHPSRTK